MTRGKVKWFDETKGYGFIEVEGEPDVFVHYSGIVGEGYRTLNEGDEVVFDVEETEKGPNAIGVRVVSTGSETTVHEG